MQRSLTASTPPGPRTATPGRKVDLTSSALLVVMWSSGFVGAELGTRTAAPATVLFWRFTTLSLLLITVCALRGIRSTPSVVRRQATLGLFSQVGYLGLIFTGVRLGVPAGVSALIAALQPLLVATVAGPLLGERTNRWQRLGLLLGLGGVALVVGGDLDVSGVPLWAYLLPLAGMLCLTTGTVLERRLRPTESLLQVVGVQAVLSAVVFGVLAASTGELTPPQDGQFWLAVVWLTCLSSIGGYGTYVFVARRQGATRVSTLLYLTPPTTMLWAFVMFDDRVTAPGLVGLLVSAAGVLLVLRRRGPLGGGPRPQTPDG